MKYTLQANQAAAYAIGIQDKVDLIDLCMFDAFKSFANSERCEKRIEGNVIWFWISYAMILDEIPLSGLKTKDAVYRRMLNLASAGIIMFNPENQRLGKTFFKWGPNYDAMERKDLAVIRTDEKPEGVRMKNRRGTDEKPEGVRMKNRRGTDEKPEGGTDEKPNNPITTLNHTTKPREGETEKKSASLTPAPALPDQLETELESYINHVEAKKEKAPQVAPPPPLIVTTHNQPQDGIKITTVEAMNLPNPDAPKFYQPTNPQAAELLMAGLGRKPMAETADEAAALIETWCKENAETVKSWYSRSKRAFSPDDLTALTIKFCGCYSNHAETGKQTRFMGDPVLFFRNGFSSWLIEQKKYDVVPSVGGATRYNSTPQDQVYKPQGKPGTHQPNFVP